MKPNGVFLLKGEAAHFSPSAGLTAWNALWAPSLDDGRGWHHRTDSPPPDEPAGHGKGTGRTKALPSVRSQVSAGRNACPEPAQGRWFSKARTGKLRVAGAWPSRRHPVRVPGLQSHPLANACFCQQAESARGFWKRWRATGQRAEAPAGQRETQQAGVERGKERTALQGRGPGPGWVQSQVSGGGESGCWLGRGSRHICWALAHTPRGVSEWSRASGRGLRLEMVSEAQQSPGSEGWGRGLSLASLPPWWADPEDVPAPPGHRRGSSLLRCAWAGQELCAELVEVRGRGALGTPHPSVHSSLCWR